MYSDIHGFAFTAAVSVVCYEGRLTCTAPGNVLSQSCAGVRAAGTGIGRESASPHLHRGPGAHLTPSINMMS